MRLSNRIINIINVLCEKSHSIEEHEKELVTYVSSLLQELYPILNQTIRMEKGVESYVSKHGTSGIDIFWYPDETQMQLIDFKPSTDYCFQEFIKSHPDYFNTYNTISCQNDIRQLHKIHYLITKTEEELQQYNIPIKNSSF